MYIICKVAVLPALIIGVLINASASAAAPGPVKDESIVADSAAKNLDQAWLLSKDASIDIGNVRGSVSVTAVDQAVATLSGSLGADSKLEISGDASNLKLRVESAKGDSGWFKSSNSPNSDSTLNLSVPRAVALKLGVVSADVKVTGVSGKSLAVDSVSGNVNLSSAAGDVEVESVSGGITFETTEPNANKRTRLQTVSGDINAKNSAARVELDSVSGVIHFASAQVQEIKAGSVSGDIQISAALAPHASLRVETMSGTVSASLPANTSAHFRAESFSGHIQSDFGTVKTQQFGPGSNLDARIGDADAVVNLQSFSGAVNIRKQ